MIYQVLNDAHKEEGALIHQYVCRYLRRVLNTVHGKPIDALIGLCQEEERKDAGAPNTVSQVDFHGASVEDMFCETRNTSYDVLTWLLRQCSELFHYVHVFCHHDIVWYCTTV